MLFVVKNLEILYFFFMSVTVFDFFSNVMILIIKKYYEENFF